MTDIKNPKTLLTAILSAAIGAVVSFLIAALTLASGYGRMAEKVDQVSLDVDRLVAAVVVNNEKTTSICERIASLEAQVRSFQSSKGG
jgi:hypothetical protein